MIWKWPYFPFLGAALNLAIWAVQDARAAPPPWLNADTLFLAQLFLAVLIGLQLWDFIRRARDRGPLQALMLPPGERAIFALGAVAMLVTEYFTEGHLLIMVLFGAAGAVLLALPRPGASGDTEGGAQ